MNGEFSGHSSIIIIQGDDLVVDMQTLVNLQITIFFLMAAGFIMTRIGVLPVSARKPLTDLVINFILPCNIIVSFLIEFNASVLSACLVVLTVSVLIQLCLVCTSRLFYPNASSEELPALQYGTIVSNAGFLGCPIVEGLYGAQGLLYGSVYLIPQRIMMWSFGLRCFTHTKGKGVFKKLITHPCIVAVGIGLFLMLLPFPVPGGLDKALRTASNCTTGLSMIIIGNILAENNIREIVKPRVLWYCFIRLLLIPSLVLVGCRLFALEELVTSISVVLAGMPAAATTAILAAKYDCDAHFAVSLVCLSTLLSLFTLPVLCLLMTVF